MEHGKERAMVSTAKVSRIISTTRKYTYAEYCTWMDDNRRCELIDGEVYDMTPAPGMIHQGVLMELAKQIAVFLSDKPCKVFPALFDVRLPSGNEKDDEIATVVQPDIVVVCDKAKLDERGCRGAPDLVVEIISPSTSEKDFSRKFFLYERHAVKEYWIVIPKEKLVMVYKLGPDGKYRHVEYYDNDDKLDVALLPGLSIDVARIFAE
jgi:Uma2 family endonuclease